MTVRSEGPPLTAAQRQLLLDAQGWLRRASRQHVVKYRGLITREDIVQTMQLALAEAARSFDPDRGASFLGFAWQRVTGAVMATAGHEAEARRPLRRILAASAGLERGEVGFEDTDEDITHHAEATTARLATAWVMGAAEPAAPLDDGNVQRVVDAAIAALPDRTRALVEKYYRAGQTLHEVAEALGVSYATVRRDNEEALAAIRKACETAGYG